MVAGALPAQPRSYPPRAVGWGSGRLQEVVHINHRLLPVYMLVAFKATHIMGVDGETSTMLTMLFF